MSEEEKASGGALLEPTQAGEPDKEKKPAPPPRNGKGSVGIYLAVLLAAAFLLLLMAYFIQQRNSEETIDGLRDSITSIESLNSLINENRSLRDEIDALEDQLAGQSEQIQALEEEQARLEDECAQAVQARESQAALTEQANQAVENWQDFWEVEQFYLARNYNACAGMICLLETTDYSVPGAAADRQAEIVEALIASGYLDEDYQSHPADYLDQYESYLPDA